MSVAADRVELVRFQFRAGGAFEIVGRAEAAALLDTHPANVMSLKGLPEPMFRLKCGPCWLASDIRVFAQERCGRTR